MASFVPSKLAYLCVWNVISLLDYVVSSLVETLQNGCGCGHCVDSDITLPPRPNGRELFCAWLQACVGFMFIVLVADRNSRFDGIHHDVLR